MDETTRTTGERDNEDELGPAERRKAAARILARGIRRLLTRVTPAAGPAALRAEGTHDGVSGSGGNRESVALPVGAGRALVSETKAG
jgi:hypothetical protein